jgi:hypothetical protein
MIKRLTKDRLREVLSYNPDTGVWIWIKKTSKKILIGDIAGNVKDGKYRQIKIDGFLYYAHVLAWLYMTGEWPKGEIDHKDNNGSKDDNRWCNLREATSSQNKFNTEKHRNNTSGMKNLSWDKSRCKWVVSFSIKGKQSFRKRYNNKEDAINAIYEVAEKLHGQFKGVSQ